MKLAMRLTLSLLIWALVWGGYLYFADKAVRGQVLDELSGDPVAGAQVSLGSQAQESDSLGQFVFQGVHGVLALSVTKPGFLSSEAEVEIKGLFTKEVPVQVILRPNQLSLYLFDAWNGEPVEEAQVRAGEQEAESDDDGGFTLYRLQSWQKISISATNFISQELAFDGREQVQLALEPETIQAVVKNLYTGQPVSGAEITWAGGSTATSEEGVAEIRRDSQVDMLQISAEGYDPAEAEHTDGETLEVLLRPNTLSGSVRDASTATPLAGVEVLLNGQSVASTDQEGGFFLTDLLVGSTLLFRATGFQELAMSLPQAATITVDLERRSFPSGEEPIPLPTSPPPKVIAHGVYITFGLLYQPDRVWALLDMVDRTGLDAVVIDLKGDNGRVGFPTEVALAKEAGAYPAGLMDVGEIINWAEEHGVYTIARMVVFKDPILAQHRPDLAAHRADGSLLADAGGALWMDPFRNEVWDYNLALAKEVGALGFDEVQFDYIRFPSDGPVSDAVYSQPSNEDSRRGAIRGFVARAQQELKPLGMAISADVFAITAWVTNDQGIGQMIEDIAPFVDYLSPMVYPSTFSPGVGGYEIPTQYPYEIVYDTIIRVRARTSTPVRPWIQHYGDYHYGVPYGLAEYLAQKQAAVDAGATGWMFWNALGIYDEATFPPS